MKKLDLDEQVNQASSDKTLKTYNWVLWVAGGVSAAACLAVLILYIVQAIRFDWSLAKLPADYIDFGIFIGSVLTPVVAAASLLLFWKTLRVQMKELAISSKSLQSTAATTERLLKQERNLFELKQLNRVIDESKSIITQLGNEMFSVTAHEFDPVTEKGGEQLRFEKLVAFNNLTNSYETKGGLRSALELDRKKLERHLNLIINLGSNLLKYARFGGDLTHIKSSYAELMRLTEPFSLNEDTLSRLFSDFQLADKVSALSRLNESLTIENAKSEDELSKLIYQNQGKK